MIKHALYIQHIFSVSHTVFKITEQRGCCVFISELGCSAINSNYPDTHKDYQSPLLLLIKWNFFPLECIGVRTRTRIHTHS